MKGIRQTVAHWQRLYWEPSLGEGLPRRHRKGGYYHAYHPDQLIAMSLSLDAQVDGQIASAEKAIRGLSGTAGEDLAGVARFLLRSEAIASSRIEDITPSAKQIALAELGRDEKVSQVTRQAQMVANNMTIVREAVTQLATASEVTVADVVNLHQTLLADEPRHHGLRTVQNWIGGSDFNPIEAAFVPPPPEAVRRLMEDLVAYMNGAAHSPIVQAALVHAQFETIHPFTDGNGRVGRALIHTVLARRGLTEDAVLPVSLVLATFRDDYLTSLTNFRYADAPTSTAAHSARREWVQHFAATAVQAAHQAQQLSQELAKLRHHWNEQLAQSRAERGVTRTVRADSATALILGSLPATPVLTSATVQRIHGVSHVAANGALDELVDARILVVRKQARQNLHVCIELLDLIDSTERRLASTKFDTRASRPVRSVPAPKSL